MGKAILNISVTLENKNCKFEPTKKETNEIEQNTF
jgi:hypothetical protein